MIILVRMREGYEIMGTVVSESNSAIELQDPLEIITTSRVLGHMLTFQRFMPLSIIHTHVIQKSDIICKTYPSEKVAEYYKVTLEVLIPKFDEQLEKELTRAVNLFQSKELYDGLLSTIDTSNLTKQ